MGIDYNSARFLFYAAEEGCSFERTATIGRQCLYLTADDLTHLLHSFGYGSEKLVGHRLLKEGDGYAEPLFEILKTKTLRSFDMSSYEGASDVHDFNCPIDIALKQSFSAVVDFGSLEHVFSFPVSIRNCMEMVAEGGHFLCVTPANNFMGHGFYQFSPELFFRVLSPENGFTVVSLILYEWYPGSAWFAVQDPAKLGRRVTLVNSMATHLAVLARRTSIVPVLSSPPYQSDYLQMWAESSTHYKPCPEDGTVHHKRRLRPLDVVRRMIRRLGFEVTRYPKHKDDWGDSREFFKKMDLPG